MEGDPGYVGREGGVRIAFPRLEHDQQVAEYVAGENADRGAGRCHVRRCSPQPFAVLVSASPLVGLHGDRNRPDVRNRTLVWIIAIKIGMRLVILPVQGRPRRPDASAQGKRDVVRMVSAVFQGRGRRPFTEGDIQADSVPFFIGGVRRAGKRRGYPDRNLFCLNRLLATGRCGEHGKQQRNQNSVMVHIHRFYMQK